MGSEAFDTAISIISSLLQDTLAQQTDAGDSTVFETVSLESGTQLTEALSSLILPATGDTQVRGSTAQTFRIITRACLCRPTNGATVV